MISSCHAYSGWCGGAGRIGLGVAKDNQFDMQTTLPLTPGNPLRNITGLSRQIALPGEHAPLRFPSFPALERTAVMGFNQPVSLDLPAGTDVAVTVTRQACWPVWADRSVSFAQIADYSFELFTAAVTTSPSEFYTRARPALTSWAVANRPAFTYQPGLAGFGSAGLFTYPILGRDYDLQGPEFVYVPAGSSYVCVAWGNGAPAAAGNVTLQLEFWNAPREVGVGTLPISLPGSTTGGMTAAISPSVGTWVRIVSMTMGYPAVNMPTIWNASIIVATASTFTYTASTTTAGTVTVTGVAPASCHLPLTQPAEFTNSQLPWFATRVTASALLGTNVSQVLNKGGTILGGRMSPSTYTPWSITPAVISNLHPAEKAYLPLETGVYTYCPPSTDLVFFSDYTLNTYAGAAASPIYVLSNDSLFNKMYIRASSVAEQLACTISWHIEFRTSSALFQVGLSAMTLESLHAAQLVLAEAGFFFENPQHDGLLNRVIQTAKKFAPEAVSVVNPTAGRLLQSLMSKMSGPSGKKKVITPKPGPSKPPTTSAKSSGITPGKTNGKKNGGKGKRK